MEININDIAKGKISDVQSEFLKKYFKEGGTWQELLKIPPEQVEALYKKGYEHYNEGQFEEAFDLFNSLIQINPYQGKYWLAVGASLHGQELYKDALLAYDIALALNEKSIPALFSSAQAHWQLEEKTKCKEFLEKITTEEPSTEMERHLHREARFLKERI